jgi:hypothetical protein
VWSSGGGGAGPVPRHMARRWRMVLARPAGSAWPTAAQSRQTWAALPCARRWRALNRGGAAGKEK